jgi:hypothetical protein
MEDTGVGYGELLQKDLTRNAQSQGGIPALVIGV